MIKVKTKRINNTPVLLSEKPRPTPGGCCPKEYMHKCCPFAGDNETILPCEKEPTSSPKARVPMRVPSLPFDSRTACVHNWRTLACAGGFYLDHTGTGKPQPCPSGITVVH